MDRLACSLGLGLDGEKYLLCHSFNFSVMLETGCSNGWMNAILIGGSKPHQSRDFQKNARKIRINLWWLHISHMLRPYGNCEQKVSVQYRKLNCPGIWQGTFKNIAAILWLGCLLQTKGFHSLFSRYFHSPFFRLMKQKAENYIKINNCYNFNKEIT